MQSLQVSEGGTGHQQKYRLQCDIIQLGYINDRTVDAYEVIVVVNAVEIVRQEQ